MTRISNITIAEQSEYCFLAIRKTIFMVEFSEFSKQSFEKFLTSGGEEFIFRSPIVCFHNMDLAKLDVEVGFCSHLYRWEK
ncbi:MAG: hypothetical protein ACLS8D_04925 [Clostridioides difficile]